MMNQLFSISTFGALSLTLFGVSFLTGTLVRHFALRHGMYAISPSGSHVALWGGLAFMLPYAVYAPVLLGLSFGYAVIFFLAIFSFVLFGLLDDVIGFSPLPQGMTQVVVSLAILFIFFPAGGSTTSQIVIGALPFFLFLLASMNAANWLDGLDGLAGATFFAALLPITGLFFFQGDLLSAGLVLAFLASLSGFLLLNVSPAKLYMGTAGSMGLGLFAGIIVAAHPNLLALLFCSLAIPLGDACRVSIQRVLAESVPWQGGDRRHLHYQLLDNGMSSQNILWLFAGVTLASSLFGIGAFIHHAPFVVFLLPLAAVIIFPLAFETIRRMFTSKQNDAQKLFAKK